MMLISRKFEHKDSKGEVVSHRTRYYKWTADGVPVFGAKTQAARLDESTARLVLRQVDGLMGGGCKLVDESEAMA